MYERARRLVGVPCSADHTCVSFECFEIYFGLDANSAVGDFVWKFNSTSDIPRQILEMAARYDIIMSWRSMSEYLIEACSSRLLCNTDSEVRMPRYQSQISIETIYQSHASSFNREVSVGLLTGHVHVLRIKS